jgi:hypothetical protein
MTEVKHILAVLDNLSALACLPQQKLHWIKRNGKSVCNVLVHFLYYQTDLIT